MSRNSKKLQPEKNPEYQEELVSDPQPTPTPPTTRPEVNNPFGISFVVPTEFVDLPTSGEYYPVTSPIHDLKKVEIKYMTAKEEDILAAASEDRDDIFDKLIDSLLVDKSISASMLLEEDKMAILLKARSTGYGNTYKTKTFCTNCNQRTMQEFDLSKTSINQPAEGVKYDSEKDTFLHTLPVSDVEVELQNLTPQLEEDIEEEREKKKKYNLPFNYTMTFLEKMIISANKVSDRKMIGQLMEVLPAADAKSVVDFYKTCRPTLSTSQSVECSNCGHVAEREVPLSWALFRTDI